MPTWSTRGGHAAGFESVAEMTRNFVELERELIADLERRTGKDLAQWMAAIDAADLAGKNAVIDWLRPQGFTFANASWLERIHNNGGRPIYLDQAGPPPRLPAHDRPKPLPKPTMPAARPMPAATSTASRPLAMPSPSPAEPIRELLARAKAFRPLAEHVLREIERALPGLTASIDGELVLLARPRVLGALMATPREVRLALDLGERPFDASVVKARLPGSPPQLGHMQVLTDARQVAPSLIELVRFSDSRANPPPPGAEDHH